MKPETLLTLQINQQAELITVNKTKLPCHYGDIKKEINAFYQDCALVDCSAHAKIALSGLDRQQFLHGMVSNEVKNLPVGHLNHSLTLTPQGKLVAEFWVFQRENEIFLLTDPEAGETAKNHLGKFLIMEEAKITDKTQSWCLFMLHGPKAEIVVNSVFNEALLSEEYFQFSEFLYQNAQCLVAKISMANQVHYFILIEPDASAELWQALVEAKATPAGLDALETYRIEQGIPKIFHELDDSVIPQEAHLDDCIHFEKGCYIGQETVARLHFRGHVNRELTQFEIHSEPRLELPLNLPIEIEHEGKKVGKITSITQSPTYNKTIGLGFLRCKLRTPGQSFEVIHHAQAITVTVVDCQVQ